MACSQEHNTPSDRIRLDTAGRIEQDIACLRCGYNLRGLRPDANCPECDEAIPRSLQGDLLHLCDPAWVAKLAGGLICMFIGFAGLLTTIMIASTVIAELGANGYMVLGLGLAAIAIGGLWRLTLPDPERIQGGSIDVRRVARFCLTGAVGFYVGGSYILRGSRMAMNLAGVAGLACVCIGGVALLSYLEQLARRLGETRLARYTRAALWGLPVSLGLALLAEAAAAIRRPVTWGAGPGGRWVVIDKNPVYPWLSGLATVSLVALIIWWIVLLIAYAIRLRAAVRHAKLTQASLLAKDQ